MGFNAKKSPPTEDVPRMCGSRAGNFRPIEYAACLMDALVLPGKRSATAIVGFHEFQFFGRPNCAVISAF